MTSSHSKAKTFLGPHVSTTNGADWAAPRSAALVLDGVDGATIEGCGFDTLGGSAVLWSGFVRNVTVANSTFSWIGGNGVLAIGDDDWGDCTDGEHPLNNTIDSCVFHELGVYAKHSAAYAEFVAGAVKITNSIIFNVPRAGIALNDAMGGGNEIAHSLIFNAVRESSDHGPINTWNRQAYLTVDPTTGKATVNQTVNLIHHNLIMAGTGASTFPLDHDDGSASYHDHHNALFFGPTKQWEGATKRTTDNIQVWPDFGGGPTRASCIDYQASGAYGEVFANNTCIQGGHTQSKWCNSDGCGVLNFRDVCPTTAANLTASTNGLQTYNNTYYVPKGNASWRSSNQKCALSIEGVQGKGEEAGSRVVDVATITSASVVEMIKALLWQNN